MVVALSAFGKTVPERYSFCPDNEVRANPRFYMFEALVYTQDRAVEISCAKAFVELGLDWMMLREADRIPDLLSANCFDFVILDVDTSEGISLLAEMVSDNKELRSVVLAVSSAPADASLLQLCYRSQVYYPVRPRDIEADLQSALCFAETLHGQTPAAAPKSAAPNNVEPQRVVKDERRSEAIEPKVFRDGFIDLGALLQKANKARLATLSFCEDLIRMRHSLSVVAQERAASGIASAGMMWYVHEVTSTFIGIAFIDPPSQGPTYLVALSVLLWLCAKSRRLHTPVLATN
jgi:hypothetical protein